MPMKKCILFLVALVCAFSARAENASGSCGENATWCLEGSTLRISGSGSTTDFGDPNSIYASYPEWYNYKDDIQKIIIDEGITSLGSFSFRGYTNLESVSLPEGLIRIGNFAFSGCSSLKAIVFPSSLEKIGDKLLNYNSNGYVFSGCVSLESITIPENLKVISGGSFNDCKMLSKVNWNAIDCDADVLDPIVRYVGIFALSPIESVAFGPKVRSIPSMAFLNVASLYHISTPGTISFVGYQAFAGTGWEKEMSEPGKVLYIDLAAYSFNHQHEEYLDIANYNVELKPGTTCLTNHLFEGSEYLERVTIPETVEYIGNMAFKDCIRLNTVDWNAKAILDSEGEYNAGGWFSNSFQVNLETINFGDQVLVLPNKMLKGCGSLKEIILPESLRKIGDSVFDRCNSIVSLTIPNSVESLGRLAISYCENLETLTIGEGLKDFDYYFFLIACPKLTTLVWNAIHTNEKSFDSLHATDVCSAPITDFLIGDKVEYVPGQLFWQSKTLSNVSFGKSVKIIGEAAFRECSALTSVRLPQSLEIISSHAFCDVPFEGVVIPENVTELGVWAFGICHSLKTVICCPKSVPANTPFADHNNDLRIYVGDFEWYHKDFTGYQNCIAPMLTASTVELTPDNPSPEFTLNIPDYTIVSIDDFVVEKTEGEHVAELNVSASGPFGDFSVVVPYRYNYTEDNAVDAVTIDENEQVIVYNMAGKCVYEGTLADGKTSLSSDVYVVKSSHTTQKIRLGVKE